jgi:outer membrane protein OmpA-like peptidoglycan-associated protein
MRIARLVPLVLVLPTVLGAQEIRDRIKRRGTSFGCYSNQAFVDGNDVGPNSGSPYQDHAAEGFVTCAFTIDKARGIKAYVDEHRTANATQGIYFDTGKNALRPESTPTLTEIGTMLRDHPTLRLTIEWHTDPARARLR